MTEEVSINDIIRKALGKIPPIDLLGMTIEPEPLTFEEHLEAVLISTPEGLSLDEIVEFEKTGSIIGREKDIIRCGRELQRYVVTQTLKKCKEFKDFDPSIFDEDGSAINLFNDLYMEVWSHSEFPDYLKKNQEPASSDQSTSSPNDT